MPYSRPQLSFHVSLDLAVPAVQPANIESADGADAVGLKGGADGGDLCAWLGAGTGLGCGEGAGALGAGGRRGTAGWRVGVGALGEADDAGFFEAEDDQAVADALLGAAGDWVRARGLPVVRGPASFSVNDDCGLLVDGFDTPNVLLTPWHPPYYGRLVERAGQPTDLRGIVTQPDLVPRLAQEAAAQWTGNFNPRPVNAESLEELYRCALA